MTEPVDFGSLLRRLDIAERNLTDLSRTVTALVDRIGDVTKSLEDLRFDRVRREERDKAWNERFDRIEDSIQNLMNLGKWVLAAFFGVLIAAWANFVVNGGLVVGG